MYNISKGTNSQQIEAVVNMKQFSLEIHEYLREWRSDLRIYLVLTLRQLDV